MTCEYCTDAGTRLIRHKTTKELHRVACACKHTLPIKFLYQSLKADCVVTAAAMATQLPYKTVRAQWDLMHDFSDTGTSQGELEDVLTSLGFAYQTRHQTSPRLGYAPRDPWPCLPWAPITLVQVVNLPDDGYHEVVLLDDGRVLDPWWGVVQGLHRYPRVLTMTAIYDVRPTPNVDGGRDI